MSTTSAIVMAFVIAVPAIVMTDLWSDVPRLAIWLARRAEKLLRSRDRAFFGWVSEVEQASLEAAKGQRSKLSVLLMAAGTIVAVARLRLQPCKVAPSVVRSAPSDLVKIRIPTLSDDGFSVEGVWAEWVGEDDNGDLYRIENHVVFSDLACCGDIVRATFHPFDDQPGYGWLQLAEVVEESQATEVRLFHNWKLWRGRRYRRVHRDLLKLGMTSEWMGEQIGIGSLPDGRERVKAIRLLRRRRVHWLEVERVAMSPEDLSAITSD